MIYFSKSTNSFYDTDISSNIPDDSISLTSYEHSKILSELYSGKQLTSDDYGYPIAIDEVIAIEIVRAKQWERIKQLRDARQLAGSKVIVDGEAYWFHTDIQSQIQHLGLYESAKNILNSSVSASMSDKLTLNGSDIIWKCMGDKMLILTVQIVFDLIEADKTLMNDTFRTAELHKIALYESENPIAYDYTTGWTESYEGN